MLAFIAALLIWIVSLVATAALAHQRGYRAVGGVILGVVFGPLAVLLMALQAPNWQVVRRCPMCRELNEARAQRCVACRTRLG
jgi:hypothetical protein